MSKFDVYECIENEEISEFLRSKGLAVWEQIQVILHSHVSLQKKKEWLECLLQQVDADDKQQIKDMMDLIEICLYQIYQTEENVIYIAEHRLTATDKCSSAEGTQLTFHDEMGKMIENLSEKCALEQNDEEIYIYQIIKAPHKKHRIKLEFSMIWIEGKLEIFKIFPDKEWLERKGIPEEIVDDLKMAMCNL